MEKPAYKLRLEDFKPGKGAIDRYATRCTIERFGGELPGADTLQYDIKVKSRAFLLGLYNGALVGGGVVGIAIGLAKIIKSF